MSAVMAMPEVREEFVKAARIPPEPQSLSEMAEFVKSELVALEKG